MFFFRHYQEEEISSGEYYNSWNTAVTECRTNIPELPFSNPWIAKYLCDKLPDGSELQFSILNSLRSWNYFAKSRTIGSMCNVGGFGIDGCTSSLLGASLVNESRLYFLITGDLAFFYDLNAIGNRHVGTNVRILLINNGAGGEFHMYNNATSQFGEHTSDYIAAGGHFGKQSKTIVKHYAEDLGVKYMSASTKEEFERCVPVFLSAEPQQSIVFECFTTLHDESMALELLNKLDPAAQRKAKLSRLIPTSIKEAVKKVL